MTGKRYIWIMVLIVMAAANCGTVSGATGIVAQTHKTSAGEYQSCTEPCECISESTAAIRWGAQGYEKCSKSICGQDANGDVQYYCIHKTGSTVPGTSATATVRVTTAAPAVTLTAPVTVSQETVNAPVTSAAVPATPSPARPAGVPFLPKIPVAGSTIIAAVGIALLAAAATGRK